MLGGPSTSNSGTSTAMINKVIAIAYTASVKKITRSNSIPSLCRRRHPDRRGES